MSRKMTPAALLKSATIALGLTLALTVPVAAKKPPQINRGLEPVHQPVVQHTDFVFDATPDGYNGLSPAERRRMLDWFDGIDLGYGDHVAIAGDTRSSHSPLGGQIAALIAPYGLLLAETAPPTVDAAPGGLVRIVVTRATATVPGCPDWGNPMEADLGGGLSRDYGCATNGNLAAMVADPDDLIRGRDTRSILRGAQSTRAIQAYRNAAPTGGGGNTLK